MSVADLTRNAVDVLPKGELEKKLALGRPLRVKLGIDVTAPHIHLGNGIPLQRMRAFQDAGHTGVLIVGDYTARIGDPSGASAERPIIAPEEIDRMAARFFESAYTILNPDRTEVRFNGEWLAKVDFAEVLRLTRTVTVARILERDDFANRFAAQQAISVSELLYPLMQAYDSVAVEADIELGGTDQLYNLLTGRDVMEAYGLEPQVVLTTPSDRLVGRNEDERLERQLHRAQRGSQRAVRKDHASAGRVAGDLLPTCHGTRAARRRAHGSKARTRAVHRRARPRSRRPQPRPSSTSRGSCAKARPRRTFPRRSCRREIRSICRRSWSSISASARQARLGA